MNLSIIIPAHNEEFHINRVVEELREELLKERIDFEILIVDDNSKDQTGKMSDSLAAQFLDVKVFHRMGNNGFGRAIREALEKAAGDCVILVMADCSDDPKDAVRIFRKLEEGYGVVYGSRFIKGSKIYNYPLFKLIINRLANYFIMALYLIKENDITNAFKGYNMNVIKTLWPLEADHFNITAELPLKAYIRGFSKTAVPVNWYGRESGVSKLSIIRMGQRYLRTVLGIWFMWVWHIGAQPAGKDKKDEHWEEYWEEKEGKSLLGKFLFKFREKFWVRLFVKFAVDMTEKGRVLEAGSGSALSSIFLTKERRDDVTALDISMNALRKAHESAKRFDVKLGVVKGDIYRLPFNDKTFTFTWNSGTLEHFQDPIPVLKEMSRVANAVICIVPAKSLAFSLVLKVTGLFGIGFKRYFIRGDEIFYTVETLGGAFGKAGLKDIYVTKIWCVGLIPYIAAYGRS